MTSRPLLLGIRQLSQRVRWRFGMRVAALELEVGTDDAICSFYQGRMTNCVFLTDPEHYEYPRARWILDRVRGGRILEVGCGNGGMTRLLARQVDHLVALDISTPSLAAVDALGLSNVETVEALVERYEPGTTFDWIVLSEVLEHLRRPHEVVVRCVQWLSPRGSLLVTTPNGHWESNEHLHEFSLESLSSLLTQSGAEAISVAYLRDAQARRRWLAGQATAPEHPPAPDTFNDWRTVALNRRRG